MLSDRRVAVAAASRRVATGNYTYTAETCICDSLGGKTLYNFCFDIPVTVINLKTYSLVVVFDT